MRNFNKLASLLDRAGNCNLADKLDKIGAVLRKSKRIYDAKMVKFKR